MHILEQPRSPATATKKQTIVCVCVCVCVEQFRQAQHFSPIRAAVRNNNEQARSSLPKEWPEPSSKHVWCWATIFGSCVLDTSSSSSTLPSQICKCLFSISFTSASRKKTLILCVERSAVVVVVVVVVVFDLVSLPVCVCVNVSHSFKLY